MLMKKIGFISVIIATLVSASVSFAGGTPVRGTVSALGAVGSGHLGVMIEGPVVQAIWRTLENAQIAVRVSGPYQIESRASDSIECWNVTQVRPSSPGRSTMRLGLACNFMVDDNGHVYSEAN